FPRVSVLSLHAPALPSTHHMISVRELAALPDGATVINTARGALLDHDALVAECRTGRLDAVLDVTDPEPLPLDSPLLDLPNVALTPHLAGSLGTETRRLTDSALDELQAYASGVPLLYPMDAVSLARSA
ncbi:MAG TPA: NAD(P)-dependent oxidoreductase, partial [Microbacterium sp.]|nr:NAD(P)-dependent oxidoreductase [Microbacterium sp.]